MKKPSIDTLHYARRLEDNGMNQEAANAVALVLNDALTDIRQEFEPIHAKLAEFDQRFATIDTKFEAMDAKFEAMDAKFEAMDAKMDTKFEAIDAKFKMMFWLMSLLAAMGAFQIVRGSLPATSASPAVVVVERPAEPLSVAAPNGEAAQRRSRAGDSP